MNHKATIRRVDLTLRTKYLDVDTKIYKVNDELFLIHCDNVDVDFEEFKKDFNYSIKFMGAPVEVVNNMPEVFEEIVPHISDKDIPKDFEGMPMTKVDLLNLLLGKFPQVQFYDVISGAGKVTIKTYTIKEDLDHGISTQRFLGFTNRNNISAFLKKMNQGITFDIVEDEVNSEPSLLEHAHHNPVQYIYSNGFKRRQTREFSERDEALWFDNVEKIYQGQFTKKNLYFCNENEYSCYVDYSTFDNIDIRNHLFLFQTVYVTLPFEKDIEAWLKTKNIEPAEFLELVKRGRIVVILTQPESRYYLDFFDEIYKANPNGIVSRRALTALQQIDIIDIADNYLLNDVKIIKELKPFCEAICKTTKADPKFMYETLIWPLKARRSSFQGLHYSGLIGIPSFGVNRAIEKGMSAAANRDLSFEFTVSSSSIHLSNALNATYFPYNNKDGFTDYHFANIMGGYLNFYRNATVQKIKSFVESRERINTGILPITPIDIIELNEYISITELENTLSRDIVYPNSKRLIEHLSGLSDADRKLKIEMYNKEVQNKISKSLKRNDVLDLGSNIFIDALGTYTGFNALGSAISLVKMGGKKLSKEVPHLKNLTSKLEESFYNDVDKANIHYLTQINRVAKVKRF